MMMSLRDKDSGLGTKQEVGGGSETSNKAIVRNSSSGSSRQWSGFKNPRIVRVSRTFGGKDRHSKVCTIKGLRDRRIRLSVPTAIQLYDLQDRLGLNQPSKVIDWLLDTTKHDIDKLPPLPILPGGFNPFHPGGATHSGGSADTSSLQGYHHHGLLGQSSSSSPFLDANLLSSRRELGININSQSVDVEEDDQDEDEDDDQSLVAKLKYWDPNAVMRSKQKGGVDHATSSSQQQISAQNFFPINASGNINTSSILPPNSSLLSNNNPMLNYYHHWEPSNLSLTQLGSTHGLASQHDHDQQSNSNPSLLPSSLSLSSSGSQLFLYPSMAATPLLFPPHPHASFMNTASSSHHQVEPHDFRQLSRFHPLSNSISSSLQNSSVLGLRPFPLSMSHHHQSSHLQQNDHDSHESKGGGDHGS